MKGLSLLNSSHLFSKALFILVFFHITSITYAMEVKEQESENRLSPLMDQNRLPKELLGVIFGHLPLDSLKALNVVSKDLNKSVITYQEGKVSSLIGQTNTLEPTLTPDQILNILSHTIEINQASNNYFLRQLLSKTKKDGFLFLQASSPLSYYLYHHPHLTSLNELHLADNFNVTSVLYKSLFNSDLPKEGDATIDFLAHLQAVWPFQHVFLPKDNQAFGAKQFLEKNKEKILEQLQSIKAEKPYISFMNHHAQEEMLKTSDANIVVTLGQINDDQRIRRLTALFENNSNHTLILTIGSVNYLNENSLGIGYGTLPPNLHSLRVVNPIGNVKSVVNGFMSSYGALISCDLSGLYGLEDIGDFFIYNCESLKSLNMLGLTNIKQIGTHFLMDCKDLISLNLSAPRKINRIGAQFVNHCTSLSSITLPDLSRLTTMEYSFLAGCLALKEVHNLRLNNVTKIEDYFLYNCLSLTLFDASGFQNVIEIGSDFLYKCRSLISFDSSSFKSLVRIGDDFMDTGILIKSFDTSGLGNVTHIGNKFLYFGWSLRAFDASNLKSLISIGDDFLGGCKSLRSFNTAGLQNLIKIGKNFLNSCPTLTSFNTVGLKNVRQIDHSFLAYCDLLKSFDTSNLTSIETVGRSFLSGCNKVNASDKDKIEQLTRRVGHN